MSKYLSEGVTPEQMREIALLVDAVEEIMGRVDAIHIDHIQIRTPSDVIIGKLAWDEVRQLVFKAKKNANS